MIQITLIQIDNYGPWTVTPKPRREADLQVLQSRLYADLESLFSSKGGLVFFSRFDNLIAITNGVTLEDHKQIQNSIKNRYPLTISFGIAAGETSLEAQYKASHVLQGSGSSRSEVRREIIAVDSFAQSGEKVKIAHIDINGVTKGFTDSKPAYENYVMVNEVMVELMKGLKEKNALLFFIGGDNFMSPCNGLKDEELNQVFDEIYQNLGISLKAGIGIAENADVASQLADLSLEKIRGKEIEGCICILENKY